MSETFVTSLYFKSVLCNSITECCLGRYFVWGPWTPAESLVGGPSIVMVVPGREDPDPPSPTAVPLPVEGNRRDYDRILDLINSFSLFLLKKIFSSGSRNTRETEQCYQDNVFGENYGITKRSVNGTVTPFITVEVSGHRSSRE